MAKRATLHPVFSHSRSHPMKRPKKAPKVWPQRTNHGVPPTIPTGYLNSGNLIFDDSSGETEEESEEEIEPGPISKKVKRATAKGCFQGDIPAPRLSPVHSPVTSRDATPLLEDDTLVEGNEFDLPLSTTVPVQLKPIQLSFTIPKNHKGPFQVTIDLNSLTIPVGTNITSVTRQDYTPARLSHGIYESIEMPVTPSTNTVSTNATIAVEDITTKVGFATLPAELRNRVYRMVFKGDLVCLGHRSNMSRSAALLATCKLILREGRTILYGENVFHFRRETKPRGKFYHERWTEVAYQDMQRFLEGIGPINITLLRDVGISFDDATPSQAPDTPIYFRRYVNDMHLRYSIQLLAKHSQLNYLKLEFLGRRRLSYYDYEILAALRKVKANRVDFGYLHEPDGYTTTRWNAFGHGHNIGDAERLELERVMVRKAVNKERRRI